MNKTQMRK